MRLDVYLHFDAIAVRVIQVTDQSTKTMLEAIMATLDDVVAKVTDVGNVEDSVIALLTDVKAKLDAAIASGDPAKLQQLSDALDAQKAKMAAAVTANTPAA